MKINKTFPICFTLLIFFAAMTMSYAIKSSVVYEKRWVAGVPVHVVTANLNDKDVQVSPVVTKNGIGRSETWGRMIYRSRPTAAITGTFFDTRSLCPTGDICIDGQLVWRGVVGTAICFDKDNNVTFTPTQKGISTNWSAYQHVLVGGPLLIWNGKTTVYPRSQGFHDPSLFARRPRTAVGVTKSGKLLFVATNKAVHLKRMAWAMQKLGAVNAAALDGGSSTALYYRGKSFAVPRRRLTNLLAVYDTSARYAEVKQNLTNQIRISEVPPAQTP